MGGFFNVLPVPPAATDRLIGNEEIMHLIECGFDLETITDPYNWFSVFKDTDTGRVSGKIRRWDPHPPLSCYDYSDKPMD